MLMREECCGGSGPKPSQGTGPHYKRRAFDEPQTALFPQSHLDRTFCPKELHACTVYTPHGGEWAYECVDFETELEACGGCASSGDGQDCTAIPNAMSVGCNRGSCESEAPDCCLDSILTKPVYTCKPGFKLNGTACVAL